MHFLISMSHFCFSQWRSMLGNACYDDTASINRSSILLTDQSYNRLFVAVPTQRLQRVILAAAVEISLWTNCSWPPGCVVHCLSPACCKSSNSSPASTLYVYALSASRLIMISRITVVLVRLSVCFLINKPIDDKWSVVSTVQSIPSLCPVMVSNSKKKNGIK